MLTNRFTLAKNAAMVLFLVVSVLLFTVPAAQADEVQATGSGILPLADYSGDSSKRSFLLGDLGGKRSEWAKKGFTFDIDYNQYFQAVTDGGVDTDSEYGGTLNYNINLDFDRMGLIPGGLLQIRARSRYGNSVNGISGTLIPVNTDATLLTDSEPDEDIGLWLPVINYTQFFSEKFALGFGKYDTLDVPNEFASGRGRSQWWNQNLNMQTSGPALMIPNVTTAASALYMVDPNLTISGMVGTSTDTSNSSGFDNFDDGLFAILQVAYQYELDELPGGLVFLPGYGWDNDFAKINGRLIIEDGQLKPTTEDSSWFASAEFWQYLWVEKGSSKTVDINNNRQDLQGVGVWSRIQTADSDTSPIDYAISGGVNARGLIPGRDNDAMGVAYAYNKLQKARFLDFVGIADSFSVWEAFYNIELTPAVHLTLDAQLSDGALPDIGTATILGASMQMRF